jgi:hypothetical protein
MRTIARLGLLALPVVMLVFAAAALADPGDDHGHDDIPVSPPSQPNFGSGSDGMKLLDVADKDGTLNSDIAFYGKRAYVGNYDGFRIFDISKPKSMDLLSDTKCRANQGDLSIFKARDGRMIMLQSIDRPVTAPDCSGVDTPTVDEDQLGVTATRARFGFEGLRMFDVTNPRNPKFLRMYRNPCGSHTHTLVPTKGAVYAYVPSYPLATHITPQVDRPQSDLLGLTCEAPHSKISVVRIPLADPEGGTVDTQPLSSDTEFYDPDGPYNPTGGPNGTPSGTQPAFQSCHDHQAFMARRIMVAACAGDAQYWSIKNPGNPTSGDGEPHTHIQREVRVDDPTTPVNERIESFEFMHNATVTWDGQVAAITDESGGGVAARCDGDQTERGFTFLYPLVEPGTPVDGFDDLLGRFITPRPQSLEPCVSHNGNVLPLGGGRDWQTQAFYQAGNSLIDFTDPSAPTEKAFSDLETSVGLADSWSSYWYNDVLYVNGGLNRRGETANRGFESYAVYGPSGKRLRTRDWKWLNPQTQEAWQAPGAGKSKKGKKG